MHDDAALEAERLEDAAHVLERRLGGLIKGVLLRRIFGRIAVDMKLAIAALAWRQRNRRAGLAHPLRKDGLILQRHGLYPLGLDDTSAHPLHQGACIARGSATAFPGSHADTRRSSEIWSPTMFTPPPTRPAPSPKEMLRLGLLR